MVELNTGLDAGDETRHRGDYLGFPHTEADGTAIGDIVGPVEGEFVTLDANGDIAAAAVPGDNTGTDNLVGVLYTYPYYGDSSNAGPYVRGGRDATVKTGGTVVVDFSNVAASPSAGDRLGPFGEALVLTDVNGDGLAVVKVDA